MAGGPVSGWESGELPEQDSPSTRGAVAGALARQYLEGHPEIWAAIQARREHLGMGLVTSVEIRDSYAAAVVEAVLSTLEPVYRRISGR